MIKLSIIIVNYRGWEHLAKCLKSLSCLDNANFNSEVIVVDNYSSDGKIEAFSVRFPSIRFIENSENFGFSNGNNLGVKNSTGKYILFLNPDTVVSLHALSTMLNFLEDHDEYNIVSCQQENEVGKKENPFGIFPALKSLTGISRAIFRFQNSKNQLKVQSKNQSLIHPDWVSGSLLLIQRENLNQVGGWSEDFWMYYEDVDLCKRLSDKGGKVALLCDIRVMHKHGGSTRRDISQSGFFKAEVLKSKHIYISKHFGGIKGCFMQILLVINNLIIERLIPALFGLVFFVNPNARAHLYLYFNLLSYYFKVVRRRSWVPGPRSVIFKTI